jgi:arylsulfatase A-like enzyme
MADQQKATSLPIYGNPDTRTPHLAALAARGVVAETCFTAHPFCLPSRVSLMTGRYAHATGTRGNGQSMSPDEVPLAEVLRAAGYRTGAVGHYHSGRGGGDRGFEYAQELTKGDQGIAWRRHAALVNAAPHRAAHMTATIPGPADEDVDGVMVRDAIRFLETVKREEPFFLHVAWMAPHPPYQAPAPYDTMYDPAALRYPAQEAAETRPRKPAHYWQTAHDMGTLDAPEPELRRALATYYGMVSLLDAQLARLLGYLEGRGLLDDTIVVYTADHGDYAGEHGMFGKSCTLYDCLTRIPLIIAGPPDLVPPGKRLRGLVQSIDVTPTLLELLDLPVPLNAHGLSLRRLWNDEPPAPPPAHLRAGRTAFDVAFAEVGAFPADMVGPENRARGDNVPAGPPATGRQVEVSVMARTPEWKLIYTPGREIQELYDLVEDPGELRNRYGEPALQSIADGLRARLHDWMLAHT